MAPQVVIKPLSLSFNYKLTRLNKVLINGEKIQHFITSTGDVRFEIKLYDVDHLSIIDNGTQISNEALRSVVRMFKMALMLTRTIFQKVSYYI